jgi:hypothetical protein
MSQPIAKSAQEHAAAFSPKLRTIALIVVATAFVMDLLDSTSVNVAIPTPFNGSLPDIHSPSLCFW